MRRDTEIVSDKLQREWERGCFWAGTTMVLVMGPLAIVMALIGRI